MECCLTNSSFYNLNMLQTQTHVISKHYRHTYFKKAGVYKKLKALAKSSNATNAHIQFITSITSDAEEQYQLLLFYHKVKGTISKSKNKYTLEHEQKIVELRKQGYTINQIMQLTGIKSKKFIDKVLEKYGLKIRHINRKKVTQLDKNTIITLRQKGYTIPQIPQITGRSYSTIHMVLKQAGLA